MNFIRTNWSMVQFHKYSLTELEDMMPWERAAFVDMLQDHIRQENETRRDRDNELKAQREAVLRKR